MRAVCLLGFAFLVGCSSKAPDRAAPWADLGRCLLGEALEEGERPSERLRRIELGSPDLATWPGRCVAFARRFAATVDGPAKVIAEEVTMVLQQGVIPIERVDALWDRVAELALAPSTSSVQQAPAPGKALTRRTLPALAPFHWVDVSQQGDEVRLVLGKSILRITGEATVAQPHRFEPVEVELVPAPAGAPIRLIVDDGVFTPEGEQVATRGKVWNVLGGGSWAVADAEGAVTSLEGGNQDGYTLIRWPSTRTALPKGSSWAKLGRDFVAWMQGGKLMMQRFGGQPIEVAAVAKPSRLMNCGAALFDPGAQVLFPDGAVPIDAPEDAASDCADGAATFTWRADDGMHRLRCMPAGCEAKVERLPVTVDAQTTIHFAGDRLVWLDGRKNLRIQPLGGEELVVVDGSVESGIQIDELVVRGDVAILWDGAKTYAVQLDSIQPVTQ